MSATWILIPVKPFAHAKSRLSSALGPEDRGRIAEAMLRDTLSAVRSCADVNGVTLIGHRSEIADIASEYGVSVLDDAELLGSATKRIPTGTIADSRLNAVIAGAADTIRREAANYAIGVLHADLPALGAHDITAVIGDMRRSPSPIFVADRHGYGTTGLFMPQGVMFAPQFGESSAIRHLQAGAAAAAGELAGLRCDVDTPEDLEAALDAGAGKWTRAAVTRAMCTGTFTCETRKV
ncbi:2-phospho-L-lactate guanylyltransferase [Hoyosella altamirensis]|uniref:Phosphoenolpyruvate guanylyltransferase n=1 Tax=Hoyosella altamirensis TaxID=616997 RepID=A0A839RIM4_9ACTN|nr:2-phospho-L-lactate guanylyltransferase [Hoyosella altamirensis]MBB3036237.1 2-phospho-L-lactate guanylyltransferase [Hoyosella altamirensis]